VTMRPEPVSDEVSEPFWRAAAAETLVVEHCSSCERFVHPPRDRCPRCRGELAWRPVSGLGTVYSTTVVHRAWLEDFDRPVPYTLLLVELTEQQGLLMVSDCSEETGRDIRIGDPVTVVFERHPAFTLPQFRPAGTVAA
jgi:uncharacterized protein